MFGSFLGTIDVERASFRILQKTFLYEIRAYEKSILATTTLNNDDSSSFRKLASYIFNKQKPIAMTSPVVTSNAENTMSFVLPSDFKNIKDLPLPSSDLDVRLEEKPEHNLAVLGFSWLASPKVVEEKGNELLKALETSEKYKVLDPSKRLLFRYNPPWCLPFFRTNEVAFEVVKKEKN
jgi:hypothetical protein